MIFVANNLVRLHRESAWQKQLASQVKLKPCVGRSIAIRMGDEVGFEAAEDSMMQFISRTKSVVVWYIHTLKEHNICHDSLFYHSIHQFLEAMKPVSDFPSVTHMDCHWRP